MAPMVLDEKEVDQVAEQVDADLTEAEELAYTTQFDPLAFTGDLSDGGTLGNVKLYPTSGGEARSQWGKNVKNQKGRPVARFAYRWDGAESLLPLSWNSEGTVNDRAQKYLLKRHCEQCGNSGFTPTVKTGNRCPQCGASGKGVIIPCYYLKFEDVPHKVQVYGKVDCVIQQCVRRGQYGFRDEASMRMHAGLKHTRQYQAHMEAERHSGQSELESLRQSQAETQTQLNSLLLLLAQGKQAVTTEPETPTPPATDRMAKARAARKAKRVAPSIR